MYARARARLFACTSSYVLSACLCLICFIAINLFSSQYGFDVSVCNEMTRAQNGCEGDDEAANEDDEK